MRNSLTLPLLLSATLALGACAKKAETPPPAAPAAAPAAAARAASLISPAAPAGAKVFFVDLKDGADVTSPVTIKFGVEGIEIAPAGEDRPNSGHHHLIIDADLPPPDAPVPADAQHLHFGKGQTEASIELAPGKHTLQLSFANYLHVPYKPALASDKITVTVR
ncbi:MAG: hypothetical protein NVS9B10_18810 [Nevskia sp.]